jgi:plasmid stabilization system protein ParE
MKLKVNPSAFRDIADIKSYICEEYDNPTAANRIADKITKTYRLLETSPYMGKQLNAVAETESDYRFLVCGNYLIFYVVKENLVIARRVIHGRRDYCKILFGNEINDDIPEDEHGM